MSVTISTLNQEVTMYVSRWIEEKHKRYFKKLAVEATNKYFDLMKHLIKEQKLKVNIKKSQIVSQIQPYLYVAIKEK